MAKIEKVRGSSLAVMVLLTGGLITAMKIVQIQSGFVEEGPATAQAGMMTREAPEASGFEAAPAGVRNTGPRLGVLTERAAPAAALRKPGPVEEPPIKTASTNAAPRLTERQEQEAVLLAQVDVSEATVRRFAEAAKATIAFNDAGGVGVGTISGVPDIEHRLALLDRAAVLNDKCLEAARGMDRELLAGLETHGVPAEHRSTALAGLRKAMAPTQQHEMEARECDQRALAASRQVLVVLKERWGLWRVTNGAIAFEDPLDPANGLIAKQIRVLNEVGARRRALAAQTLTNRR